MDAELVADWHALCRDEREVDSSEFLTLFHDGVDRAAVADVIACLPNAHEVGRRVLAVAAGPDLIGQATDAALMGFAAADLTAKRAVAVELGEDELVEFIDAALAQGRLVPIDEFDEALHGERHGLFIEVLGDYFASEIGPILTGAGVDVSYAISEAFYGLTTLFEIAWYLAAPLRPPSVDVDTYFELWRRGGRYAIGTEELLVTAAGL